jgi:hypothetical protein
MAFVWLLKVFKIFPYKMNFSENYLSTGTIAGGALAKKGSVGI